MMEASIWVRASAYLIDILIISVILLPLKSFNADGYTKIANSLLKNPGALVEFVLISLVIALITILYFALLEYRTGQTLGKMLMKIKVVSGNKKITFNQAFVRNISKMSLLFILIDCLNMAINKTNQRFLERLTGTEVINLWAK